MKIPPTVQFSAKQQQVSGQKLKDRSLNDESVSRLSVDQPLNHKSVSDQSVNQSLNGQLANDQLANDSLLYLHFSLDKINDLDETCRSHQVVESRLYRDLNAKDQPVNNQPEINQSKKSRAAASSLKSVSNRGESLSLSNREDFGVKQQNPLKNMFTYGESWKT